MSEDDADKLLRLVLILAPRILVECDNVGGYQRPTCRCESCDGWRLIEELTSNLPEHRKHQKGIAYLSQTVHDKKI